MQASQSCTASQDNFQVKRLLPFTPDKHYRALGSLKPRFSEEIGLVHDAGNLLGALGLYADLLASPGVLADHNRFYAEEIKQIAERSHRLIEKLMLSTDMQSDQSLTKIADVYEWLCGPPKPRCPLYHRTAGPDPVTCIGLRPC